MILAGIIRRDADGAGLEKRVSAYTLCHTAVTWLRQQRGDARFVAAYLGDADLSTVIGYAQVAEDELHGGAAACASSRRLPETPSGRHPRPRNSTRSTHSAWSGRASNACPSRRRSGP
jgi:hypothetical protein